MKISTAIAQGEALAQQDHFITVQNQSGALLAVTDGHGGDAVANFIANNLERLFFPLKRRVGAFVAIASVFKKLDALTKNEQSGATLSIAWLSKSKGCAYIGILGDSPVAIQSPACRSPWIGPRHNFRINQKERVRAGKLGGIYICGYMFGPSSLGTQVSRSLGDKDIGPIISHDPEIFAIPIPSGSTIALMTDGVADPARAIWMASKSSTANDLIQDALQRDASDNVAAIVSTI